MNTWTDKWPTKEGIYWFYGWPYGRKKDFDNKPVNPELGHLKVVKVSNGILYVLNGNFWSRKEGGIGLFIKANIPKLPKLSKQVKGIKIWE